MEDLVCLTNAMPRGNEDPQPLLSTIEHHIQLLMPLSIKSTVQSCWAILGLAPERYMQSKVLFGFLRVYDSGAALSGGSPSVT